ncbi:MAG: hypothetical protein M1818_008463 [Claussenomyces sp. TS43310]|nr:MAG: hypothetical protein M1818_008463 [Claussenomyces sp. TS43310]
MATVVNPIVSANRVEAGSFPARLAEYPNQAEVTEVSPPHVVQEWLDTFNAVLDSGDVSVLTHLFMTESYWRDQLCMSWDFHTLQGTEKIINFLEKNGRKGRIQSLQVDESAPHKIPSKSALDFLGKESCVQAWIKFKTEVGAGVGIVRLVKDANGGNRWKAYTLFTTLRELTGYEEPTGHKRPLGVNHGGDVGRTNWQDRRIAAQECADDPVVLVVGAGQGGITLAARLKQLGIETLVIDANERIGDSWRNRYHQLVLHDPVWYDHLPYLEFPPNWPVFTPKDKLAEWFESYVKTMEITAWTSTSITKSDYDDATGKWAVTLERTINGKPTTRELRPKHIVQATGHSGEKNFPAYLRGISDFKGDRLCHSSEFSGAMEDGEGKNAVVVGCCNSGHDIAQDFYEKGYNVTMVQRSSTYVLSSKNVLEVLLAGLYEEGGIPVDDADLVFMSSPIPVLKRAHRDVTAEISKRDADLLDGLAKAGFNVDSGPDGCGFWMKYLQRGGGYYIDVGCSQLIIDGRIAVLSGTEIDSINAHSISFTNGRDIRADEIVFATGYQNMRSTTRKVFGDTVADRVGPVWGLDEEGELRTIWRSSGHPGFWFMGGNLALCRYFSRLLALQIKAQEVGLLKLGED